MRKFFIVMTKKRLTLFATILAVILIFFTINDPAIVGASATTRELPIYCVKRDNKAVSLTFDAAWGKKLRRKKKYRKHQCLTFVVKFPNNSIINKLSVTRLNPIYTFLSEFWIIKNSVDALSNACHISTPHSLTTHIIAIIIIKSTLC